MTMIPLPNSILHQGAWRLAALATLGMACTALSLSHSYAAELKAGAAKVDITDRTVPIVNDPLYVKALVIGDEKSRAVIVTVDAVAIAEIGTIRNEYLSRVRARLQSDLGLDPKNILINASHCHGVVAPDVEDRTVQAVKAAWQAVEPVKVGAGIGHENRVMENRRLKLKDGTEADVRHAYSLPPDERVAAIGPTDPEIGILRIDRTDGRPLAVVYNFACHPIQGVPNFGNTADMTGFASKVIEDNLGPGATALFVQGCGGDINPVLYKQVGNPRDAEPLGNMLGLSTLQGWRKIKTGESSEFKVVHAMLGLPRANNTKRIEELEAERSRVVQSLKGTSLNVKTFLPLMVQYNLAEEYPSYYSHRYLHDAMIGKNDLARMDEENRKNIKAYLANIYAMEELTRIQTNLALLRKHHTTNEAARGTPLEVELVGLRVGKFYLVSFPGEATVEIGLNIKKASPHELTFVAGYSNGYIYYAPTAQQLKNVGRAQEDSDCLLAPEWQRMYEEKALGMLKSL